MKYIVKSYKEHFGALLKPLGFRSYKKSFFRIINEIIQVVVLVDYSISADIEYAIFPLAMRRTDGYLMTQRGQLSVTWFRPDGPFHWQQHGPKGRLSDEEIDGIIFEMQSIVLNQLLPVFERVISCKELLLEIQRLKKLFPVGRPFLDTEKFWCYLKERNFTEAISLLNDERPDLKKIEEWLKGQFRGADEQREQKRKQEYTYGKERDRRIDAIIERLKRNDVSFVNEIIAFNEEKSRVYLKHPSRVYVCEQPFPWDLNLF